ncbi:alternate-type signal peptide domain-containing protein [Mycetocola tolaasinivorans]|uniref:Alternate-type signal peptide domain-containing protein n=1 Tax=Mycetocola tolaasinivorans TaxID=76635 RepID=A0A3L7A4N1_9MICO|nr:alternate-type signal peptide domain-containing protein [Mycetocola tolaasinivorans]RLP74531.1 alternate-type signal peptide domain-containing protein [Mycetocola tolaasinivorans]
MTEEDQAVRKLIAAALASLVGAALLFGGAGTLAFWTDSKDAAPLTIQSGSLSIGPIGSEAATWTLGQDVPGGRGSAAVRYTGQALVPGDILTATVNVPVELVGTDMAASLAVSALTVTAASGKAADQGLAQSLVTRVVSVGSAQAGPDGQAPTATIRGDVRTVPVVISATLPWATTSAMSGSVKLAMTYTLTQQPIGAAS